MDKYIIYTMGVPEINEAVQKVLFEKGYGWQGDASSKPNHLNAHHITINLYDKYRITYGATPTLMEEATKGKEITFRELMELPPVHDELEELAEKVVSSLYEISKEYRERHLKAVEIIRKIRLKEPLNKEEEMIVADATGMVISDLLAVLEEGEPDNYEDKLEKAINEDRDSSLEPKVVCTSLRGAKGLSASYVYIVGLNDGHFPRNPKKITDDEICSLLVGLSRTRKQCCLISCGRFGNEILRKSVFLKWISHRLTEESIDANYFQRSERR